MELMNDPVMVATGHTYDRVCIERWLQQGNRTCPVTGMRLRHLELTPNFALRNAIQVSFVSAWGSVHESDICSWHPVRPIQKRNACADDTLFVITSQYEFIRLQSHNDSVRCCSECHFSDNVICS